MKLLLWSLHKGNWLSANDENMLVMISPLKSNFPKTRLQEMACRCHEVFINLYRAVAPRICSKSFQDRIAAPFHVNNILHLHYSKILVYSVAFWRMQAPPLGTYLTPPLPVFIIHQPHRLFLFLKRLKLVPTLESLYVLLLWKGMLFPK